VHSRYLLGLGLLLVAFGCNLMTHVHANSSWTVLLPGFIVAGLGVGTTNPVLASASVSVVPPERSGMASGSANTFRQVGFATGIAGLGAVFLSQVVPNTLNALAASPGGRAVQDHGGSRLAGAISGGNIREVATTMPAGARHTLVSAYQVGFTTTLNHLMAIATVVALVGAVGSFALVRQRDFVPSYSPAPDGTPSGPPAGEDGAPGPLAPVTEGSSEFPSAASTG
jgi:hypothetical protein